MDGSRLVLLLLLDILLMPTVCWAMLLSLNLSSFFVRTSLSSSSMHSSSWLQQDAVARTSGRRWWREDNVLFFNQQLINIGRCITSCCEVAMGSGIRDRDIGETGLDYRCMFKMSIDFMGWWWLHVQLRFTNNIPTVHRIVRIPLYYPIE